MNPDGKLRRRLDKLVHHLPILLRESAYRLGIQRRGVALVIPPTGVGSLGDQAMLQSVADHLHLLGCSHLRQLLMPRWQGFPIRAPELFRLRFSEAEILAESPALLTAIRAASVVTAIGADVIDGRYGMQSVRYQLGMLTLAARLGVPAALLGHSISESPEPGAMQLLAELPPEVAIYVRDPVSQERFFKHTGRMPILAADLAFLVKPDGATTDHAAIRDWVNARKAAGDIVLCLNVNGLTAEAQAGDIGAEMYWQRFLKQLWQLHPQTSVLFLSHDPRPEFSDAGMHARIAALLPAAKHSNFRLIADQTTAARAKAVSMLADLVLTGRMHLAIGALSQGVPTFCVAYAGKFEGLARHIDVSDFTVPESLLPVPESAAAWLAEKFGLLPERRQALQQILPGVLTAARQNFTFATAGRRSVD